MPISMKVWFLTESSDIEWST